MFTVLTNLDYLIHASKMHEKRIPKIISAFNWICVAVGSCDSCLCIHIQLHTYPANNWSWSANFSKLKWSRLLVLVLTSLVLLALFGSFRPIISLLRTWRFKWLEIRFRLAGIVPAHNTIVARVTNYDFTKTIALPIKGTSRITAEVQVRKIN